MLATSQEFINGLLDHLPQKLQLIAEIAVYFALLTALMMIPLVLWLGVRGGLDQEAGAGRVLAGRVASIAGCRTSTSCRPPTTPPTRSSPMATNATARIGCSTSRAPRSLASLWTRS